jgi:hypothetical protein
MEFLKDYKDAAEGFDRLKSDIKLRFVTKPDNTTKQSQLIITEDLEQELKKLRNKH